MKRLPYGTFKKLTPEEQKAHMRALHKQERDRNREKINAYNRTFFDRWKIEKPFVCTCKYCGNKFNAPRNNRYVCASCHEQKRELAYMKRMIIIFKRQFKKNRDTMILGLAKKGMSQTEISRIAQVSPRVVSYTCKKMVVKE